MPKKQNGFGSPKGFSFTHKQKPIDKAFGGGAAGFYPSNRRYGSSVHRSVIEHWDLNSTWAMWRKGYEASIKSAWDTFKIDNPTYGTINEVGPPYVEARIDSLLYAGTPYELATSFTGTRYPTSQADSSTHYVAKREVNQEVDLGVPTVVYNDPLRDKDNFDHGEIWIQGAPGDDALLLRQMPGERLSDGITEATVKMVLDRNKKPAVYRGKSWDGSENGHTGSATEITLTIPLSSITEQQQRPAVLDQGLRKNPRTDARTSVTEDPSSLIGKIISVPNFFIERTIADENVLIFSADGGDFYGLSLLDVVPNLEVIALDPGSTILPPSMYDLASLDPIFTADGVATITGTWVFSKAEIQRWYGRESIDGVAIIDSAEQLSYAILPFAVQDARINGTNLVISAVPFSSELKLYPPIDPAGYVVFTDKSFARTEDGSFDMNVDPWQDEVFSSGNPLTMAPLYTCSCPAYTHSLLAMPQSDEEDHTRKTNRQRRYPLPTVMGMDRWMGLEVESVSGKMSSWETQAHRESLKICKHCIAERFNDGIKVIEPNTYPTVEARIAFEAKLEQEIDEYNYDFKLSYKRSEMTLMEIIFALAQGLNLDEVETAYVLYTGQY